MSGCHLCRINAARKRLEREPCLLTYADFMRALDAIPRAAKRCGISVCPEHRGSGKIDAWRKDFLDFINTYLVQFRLTWRRPVKRRRQEAAA